MINFMMIEQSAINCKIELIENFQCNNEEELKNKKNKIYTYIRIRIYV